MKKIFSMILALVLVCSLLPALPASAAEYPLWIAGTKVTSANASDILENGLFSYDASAKRLDVKGSYSYDGIVIDNSIPDLTINSAHSVTLRGSSVIYTTTHLTITGGELDLIGTTSGVYAATGGGIKIDNARLVAKGDVYGISGSHGETWLRIDNSNLLATGSNGAVVNFNSISYADCDLCYPSNSRVKDGNVVEGSTSVIAKKVIFAKGFDLYVAGKHVNTYNANDILGDGKFAYNPGTNTLTVKGDCRKDSDKIIDNSIPNLIVYAAQDALLACNHSVAIYSDSALTITGPGKLTVTGHSNSIRTFGNLTIKDANLKVTNGLDCRTGSRTLLIRNSYVDISGNPPAEGYSTITLDSCKITTPEHGRIVDGSFVDADGNSVDHVVIEPVYDLWIAGTQVNRDNCDDILGNGLFSYNPTTMMLQVKGSYNAGSITGIYSSTPGLIIYPTKNVTLSSGANGIVLCADATISGPGKLTVNAADIGFLVNSGAKLRLNRVVVNVSGSFGVMGSSSGEVLNIDHSELFVTESTKAIFDFNSIVLEQSVLQQPEQGKIQNGCVYDKNNNVASRARITPIYYGFIVTGIDVTSANAPDIRGDGKFSYAPETNTLTVRGSCSSIANIIVNEADPGLTVYLAEDVTFESTTANTVQLSKDTKFTGPGKLTVLSTVGAAFHLSAGTLCIENAYVDAHERIEGHFYEGKGSGHLVVRNSVLHAEGEQWAIYDLEGITLEQSRIIDPAGAYPWGGNILNANGTVPSSVTIVPDLAYPLWIAGTQVTSSNAQDVLGDGAFSYDAAENRLSVKGSCSGGDQPVIRNEIQDLTVYVTKNVSLSSGANAITTNQNLTITGPGTLNVSSSFCAILAQSGAKLRIENTKINAIGTYYGITGVSPETLFIRSSDVYAKGSSGAICDFGGGITVLRCAITQPRGGKVSEGRIIDKNGELATEVTISQSFDLWIAGTQVSYANAADVLGDGSFHYNAESNTLTLKGDKGYDTGILIQNSIPDLTIYVSKHVFLTAGSSVILSNEDFTITGPGMLTVSSNASCGIYVKEGATLLLDHATVDATGTWGIAGAPSGETLIVRSSTVNASGSQGAVCDFDKIDLVGEQVTIPAGGKVREGSVVDENGVLASVVQITPLPNPFVDVKPGKFYYDAVLWAYCHDPRIASGTSDNTFSPNATCTREQIVTYLWHALGDPEPTITENPFHDVKKKHYFYKAVLWAVENGVTSGVNADTFGVGQPCTRAQAMTFLWNALGKPEPESAVNPFTDVKPGKFYYKAVLWAVENGITSGVGGGKFGVNDTCTRGQIVTFLFIAMVKLN